MNGTLLFRRSASIVLASFLLTASACGVELGGLFDGDAGPDVATQRDAGQDAVSTTDRAPDLRLDASADGSSSDRDSATDLGAPVDRGSTDATIDASLDASDADATVDASLDSEIRSDGSSDGSIDGDVTLDAGLDGDGARDVGSDPQQDATAEDTAAEPRLDAPSETAVDAVADASADTSRDTVDDGPPGICMAPCNTFDNIAQTITRTVDPGSPPTMTGGNLVDGTYVTTSIVQYNGDTTTYTLAETSVISGNMDAWVASTNGNPPVRYTTTFTTTNNQMAFTLCCPTPGNLTISYTTDGTTISHVDPANPNRIITYTRQ